MTDRILTVPNCRWSTRRMHPSFSGLSLQTGFSKTGLLDEFPHVKAWADALLSNEVVTGAVAPNFLEEFYGNLKRREFYIATLLTLLDDPAAQAAE